MRMRKKKNLEARMEVCAALWVKDPVQMRGAWREKMPGARLLRLELGCGKGALPPRPPQPIRRTCMWRWSGYPTPWSSPWSGAEIWG